MFQFLKITGNSLTPEYNPGDYVLIIKIPYILRKLRPGDTLIFKVPLYGILIKQLDHIEPESDGLFVVGTHFHSLDSRELGAIPRSAVIGKVIWHIHKD